MYKSLKKGLFYMLILAMTFSLLTGMACAENQNTKDSSMIEYVNWLETEISNSDGTKSEELSKVLKQFESLSKENQQKFVNYLNNRDTLTEIINAYSNTDETASFYNGDITIEKIEYIELLDTPSFQINTGDIQILSIIEHRKATYLKKVVILGINVFETTSWVSYYHDGSKVLSISGFNHFVSRNFTITLDADFSGQMSFISLDKTRAYSTTDLTFSLIWDGLGIVLGGGDLGVWGDVNNNTGGYYYAY